MEPSDQNNDLKTELNTGLHTDPNTEKEVSLEPKCMEHQPTDHATSNRQQAWNAQARATRDEWNTNGGSRMLQQRTLGRSATVSHPVPRPVVDVDDFVRDDSRAASSTHTSSVLPSAICSVDTEAKRKLKQSLKKGTGKSSRSERKANPDSPGKSRSEHRRKQKRETLDQLDPSKKRSQRSKSDNGGNKPSLRRNNTDPETEHSRIDGADSLESAGSVSSTGEKGGISSFSMPPGSPEVVRREGDIVRRVEGTSSVILFGRLEPLIDLAMSPYESDNDQVLSTLLYTYPFFYTGHKLLESIVGRLDAENDELQRSRLVFVLTSWLSGQYNWEIDYDKTLSRSIEKLVKGKLASENKAQADDLERDLRRVQYMRPTGVQVVDVRALAHNPQGGPHFNALDFKSWLQERDKRAGGNEGKRKNLIRRTRTAAPALGQGERGGSESVAGGPSLQPHGAAVDASGAREAVPKTTLVGLAHRVFTINFQDTRKSVILTDTIRAQPLKEYLATICQQRGIDIYSFVPEDLNRKALSLDTLVGEIPGGEIFFCTVPEVTKERKITVHVEGGEDICVSVTKELEEYLVYQFLESSLETPREEFSVETPSGSTLGVETRFNQIQDDIEILHLKLTKTDVKARKTLGSRAMSVFGEANFKNLPSELIQARKKYLRDPNAKSSILLFRADELAQALTAIEHELFTNIPSGELVGSGWKKKTKVKDTPHVVAMINWFNRITNWIKSEVMLGVTPKERGLIIERLISTAQYCKLFKNYNSLIEIVSALNGQAVRRLKQSWNEVPIESKEIYTKLEKFFSPVDNYAKLRKIHTEVISERVKSPAIPYIGIILEDLMKMDEIPNFTEDDYVNWSKMQRVAVNFQLVRTLQRKKYDFDEFQSQAQDLMEFLASDSLVLLTESDQLVWSRLLEENKKKSNLK
eukprot:TRINITY_DN7544_c0_g1_i1.p1 TRINITY_DN7544_c0_g1~~TRINITY_DN7544_c0_g1_i1.p1  ORF type:complete len:924 (+),score=148.73 TRINITY_DN7544_c0_g1_i1:40-2811(+)